MDDGPDELEWLDAGPPVLPGGWGRERPRWRWWYALVALALLGLVVVDVHQHQSRSHPAAVASTPPSTAAAPTPSIADAAAGSAPISVVDLGRPLLKVPSSWELFTRSEGAVVRIQLAAGRTTTTTVPELASSGPVSFVVVAHEAIVRPLDNVLGYLVPDGQPAQPLIAPFSQGGPLLPGPDLAHVWVQTGDSGEASTMTLVGLDGSSTGRTAPVPANTWPELGDGTGYPLLIGTGGAYVARPDGDHRVTTGSLLAVGPTRWLTVECDAGYHCATTVTDRATGARHTLPTPTSTIEPDSGVISPDGTTAAVFEPSRNGTSRIDLLDLSTGADNPTRLFIDVTPVSDPGTFVWSPDSRYLFVADDNTAPAVVDKATNGLTRLDVTVPEITQIAFRADAG
jgi:hypothetical protein